jgi:hypothetical protein
MPSKIDGSRVDMFRMDPRKLKRITDPGHFLFRESVNRPAKPGHVASLRAFKYDKGRPMRIWQDGKDGPWCIVDGRKIHAAALVVVEEQIKQGVPDDELLQIFAVQVSGDEAALSMQASRANSGAEEDSPSEKAELAQAQLLMLAGTLEDAKPEHFAKVASVHYVDPATIKRWVNFNTLPTKIKRAVDKGFGFNRALTFFGLPHKEAIEQFEASKDEAGNVNEKEIDLRVKAHKDGKKKGKTEEEIVADIQRRKASPKPAPKVIKEVRQNIDIVLEKKLPASEGNAFALEILRQWIDYNRDGTVGDALADMLAEVSRDAEKQLKADKDAAEKSKEKGK